jgi:putative flavoprotein involved in K+ transport
MATAACLQRERVEFDLIDRRGECGGAYRRMYDGLELLSPACYAQLPGLPIHGSVSPIGEYVTAPQYRQYLAEYAQHFRLQPSAKEVQLIVRTTAGLRVSFTDSDQPAEYSAVVVATGMFDAPFVPKIEGLISATCETLHSRDWPGPARFAKRRVLVVGGGMSGVEIAEECARAGVDVTLSSRRRIRLIPRRFFGREIHHWVHLVSHRLPLWTLGSFCDRLPALPAFDRGFREFCAAGKIALKPELLNLSERSAEFSDGSRDDVDAVVFATGYRFQTPFLSSEVARGSRGQPLVNKNQSRTWPNLFFIGFPCARIMPSEFLRGIALDAPVVARRIRSILDVGQ